MAGIGSVVIQFLGKDKLSDVAGKVGLSLTGVDQESGKARWSFGKLSAAWATALPIAGAVIGIGVGMANVLIDASKAALEDKNSSDKLAGVLGKIPGVTEAAIAANEDWISSMQLATLVSDTDLRGAVQKLALATGDLAKAQELTRIAVDASTGSGKNLSAVTDAMAKAANGNTNALKRMFPWLDANRDGTVTYAEAVKGLGDKFKGASKEAAKTKPWEVIQTIWGEIQESLGGALLPLFQEFGEWFSKKKTQDAIRRFIDKVGELATTFGEDLVSGIKDAIAWLKKPENQKKIQDWVQAFKDLAGMVKSAVEWVQKVITWLDKIPKLPSWMGKLGFGLGAISNSAPAAAATATARTATTATPQPAPVVMVTEEQIARAIQRVLMRSDARNGRITRIA